MTDKTRPGAAQSPALGPVTLGQHTSPPVDGEIWFTHRDNADGVVWRLKSTGDNTAKYEAVCRGCSAQDAAAIVDTHNTALSSRSEAPVAGDGLLQTLLECRDFLADIVGARLLGERGEANAKELIAKADLFINGVPSPDVSVREAINARLVDLAEANALYGKDNRLGAPDKIARNDREISWLKDLRSMIALAALPQQRAVEPTAMLSKYGEPAVETAINAIVAWQANKATTFTPTNILNDFGDAILAQLRAAPRPALDPATVEADIEKGASTRYAAQSPGLITDEMIERAIDAHVEPFDSGDAVGAMRAALEAALGTAGAMDEIESLQVTVAGLREELARACEPMGELVEFFRGEGFESYGRNGDYEGWTPERTAIEAMRELSRLKSGTAGAVPSTVPACATCGGLKRIPHESGGYGVDCTDCVPSELEAARSFLREKPSTSYLQRKMQIGYVHAARIIEKLEDEGFISRADSAGRRTILNPVSQTGRGQS